MKILIYSSLFYPSVGGLETVMEVLAREFSARGHAVRLVTQSSADRSIEDDAKFPFPVIRRPGPAAFLAHVRWSEVYLQGCVSLKALWPLIFAPRPLVLSHQTWYRRLGGQIGVRDRLKLAVCRRAKNIAASAALAATLPPGTTIIPNSYDAQTFRLHDEIHRTEDLIFVGRLVSDKGVATLLDALGKLKQEGLAPRLTIVGSGPEEQSLRTQAAELGIAPQLAFLGTRRGADLCKLLNAHRIMVIPSRWAEPFGIVALEGIAAGCVPVGSASGGLPEAIGPCGETFPNGDSSALAAVLKRLLSDDSGLAQFTAGRSAHLDRHTPGRIAELYLAAFEEACR